MRWMHGPKMAVVWTIFRIWLGIQWIEGGWEKISAGGFDASGFMQGAIAKAGGEHPAVQAWYASFLEHVAVPNAGLFSFLVQWGELLVGIGLIVGIATIPALLAGTFMNLNFLLAGTTSTNPILFTVGAILLFAGSASYYYGGDRFLVPYIKEKMAKKGAHKVEEGHATV
ncbi:DoxX family membrane protein [Schinkia sp. CFF1]